MGDEQLVGESHRQRMARTVQANRQAAKRQKLAEHRSAECSFSQSVLVICGQEDLRLLDGRDTCQGLHCASGPYFGLGCKKISTQVLQFLFCDMVTSPKDTVFDF